MISDHGAEFEIHEGPSLDPKLSARAESKIHEMPITPGDACRRSDLELSKVFKPISVPGRVFAPDRKKNSAQVFKNYESKALVEREVAIEGESNLEETSFPSDGSESTDTLTRSELNLRGPGLNGISTCKTANRGKKRDSTCQTVTEELKNCSQPSNLNNFVKALDAIRTELNLNLKAQINSQLDKILSAGKSVTNQEASFDPMAQPKDTNHNENVTGPIPGVSRKQVTRILDNKLRKLRVKLAEQIDSVKANHKAQVRNLKKRIKTLISKVGNSHGAYPDHAARANLKKDPSNNTGSRTMKNFLRQDKKAPPVVFRDSPSSSIRPNDQKQKDWSSSSLVKKVGGPSLAKESLSRGQDEPGSNAVMSLAGSQGGRKGDTRGPDTVAPEMRNEKELMLELGKLSGKFERLDRELELFHMDTQAGDDLVRQQLEKLRADLDQIQAKFQIHENTCRCACDGNRERNLVRSEVEELIKVESDQIMERVKFLQAHEKSVITQDINDLEKGLIDATNESETKIVGDLTNLIQIKTAWLHPVISQEVKELISKPVSDGITGVGHFKEGSLTSEEINIIIKAESDRIMDMVKQLQAQERSLITRDIDDLEQGLIEATNESEARIVQDLKERINTMASELRDEFTIGLSESSPHFSDRRKETKKNPKMNQLRESYKHLS